MILNALRSLLPFTDHPSGRRPTEEEIDELLKVARQLPALKAAVRRVERDQKTIRETLEQLMLDSWRDSGGG